MDIFKTKIFWVNLIALILNLGQYIITNNLLPEYAVVIAAFIGMLQVIYNTVAGVNLARENKFLKAKLLLK
jgi:hypothetical protein